MNTPILFLANLIVPILFAGTAFVLIKTRKDGYWGSSSEESKYHVLEDNDEPMERHHG